MEIITSEKLKSNFIHQLCLDTYFNLDILEALTLVEFNEKEYIIKENVPLKNIVITIQGKFKISKTLKNGIEGIINISNDSQIYGELELITPKKSNINLQSLTTSYCFLIDIVKYRELLLNSSQFLQFCILQLGNKLNNYDNNFLNNIHIPLRNRLANYINLTTSNDIFHTNYTHLASYLGCSYRHLLRELKYLCDQDILVKIKNGYLIKNKEYLK